MLDHTKPYVEKIHYIDVELAGHVHKLDVKLQSLCGSGFSLFAVRIFANSYHFGVNWQKTHSKNRDGVNFFTLIFECHNRYNKLWLCNFLKMVILHDAVKIIESGFFCAFFKKRTSQSLDLFYNVHCWKAELKKMLCNNLSAKLHRVLWYVHFHLFPIMKFCLHFAQYDS